METLLKHAVRLGNSAGVLLPKEWLGNEVRVTLIEKPINIKQDILKIVEPFLDEVIGIYITGSYARGEQKHDSDIDILVITENKNKIINLGKYHIIVVSLKEIKKALEENIITILPLLKEAKSILNKSLLEELKKADISKDKLKWHIDTSKSALKIVKSLLNFEDNISENTGIVYSLILRLREVYIAECLLKDKDYSTKGLMNLLNKNFDKKVIDNFFGIYRAEKENRKIKIKVLKKDIEKLYQIVNCMIKHQEEDLYDKRQKNQKSN